MHDLERVGGRRFTDEFPSSREYLLRTEDMAVWFPFERGEEVDLSALSKREREVWQWMLEGKSLAETATILGISPRTVEKHRQNLRHKLMPSGST